MSETQEAQWCEEVLGTNPETLRRHSLRTELLARVQALSTTAIQRIAALTKGTHGADELISAFERQMTALDNACSAPDFTSDTGERGTFDTTAQTVQKTLDALGALALRAQTAGTAQGIEARELKAAEQQRDILKSAFASMLKDIGEDLSVIHEEISPGKLDTDLRDLTTPVHKAFQAPAFAKPTSVESFRAAYNTAQRELEGLQTEAEEAIAPALEKAAALKDARAALKDALNDAGSARPDPFAEALADLTRGLESARDNLQGQNTPAIRQVETLARAERNRIALIAAAAQEAARLEPEVTRVANAATPTPQEALRDAWDKAVRQADQALRVGNDATATLRGIDEPLRATDELNQALAGLRLRADELEQAQRTLPLPPGRDQAERLQGNGALLSRIRGDVTEIGTLGTEMTEAEQTLREIGEAIMDYARRMTEARNRIKDLPPIKGMRRSPSSIISGRLDSIDSARTRDHQKGAGDLALIEQQLPDFVTAATAIGQLDALENDARELSPAISSARGRVGNNLTEFKNLSRAAVLASETERIVRGFIAYKQDLEPLQDQINRLSKVKDRAISRQVKSQAEAADKAARNGEDWQTVLRELARQMPAMDEYVHDSGPIMAELVEARKAAQRGARPLGTLLARASNTISGAAGQGDFATALEALRTVWPLLPFAAGYISAHAAARALLDEVKDIAPTGDVQLVTQANDAFERRFEEAEALEETTTRFTEATGALETLSKDLTTEKTARRKAVKDALGPATGGQDAKLGGVFADEEAVTALNAVVKELGATDLGALLKQIGAVDEVPPGAAAARAIKQLQKDLGGKKLKALGQALGGFDIVGDLCSKEGGAYLPVELHAQFASDFAPLGTLLGDGFGGDAKQMRAVVGASKTGGERAKQLSDAFVDRSELETLLTNLGNDGSEANATKAGDKMRRIAGTHFGNDWSKLKDPFYDKLSVQPTGDKLMENAALFTVSSVTNPPQVSELHGFSSVDMTHVLERHRPSTFAMSKPNNIKLKNSQFPPDLSPSEIAACVEEALGEAAKLRTGDPSALGFDTENDGNFQKCMVPVKSRGIWMQIGYDTTTDAVDQAFPFSDAGAQAVCNFHREMGKYNSVASGVDWGTDPIAMTDYSNVEMTALKEALGR